MEKITIDKQEYLELLKTELFLNCLEENGVGDWENYVKSWNMYEARKKEEGLDV